MLAPGLGGSLFFNSALATLLEMPGEAFADPLHLSAHLADGNEIPDPPGAIAPSIVITASTLLGEPVINFSAPFTLTLGYESLDLTGYDERNLRLYSWNDTSGGWSGIPLVINTTNHTAQAILSHLTRFVLVGNPYKVYLPIIRR